MAKTKKAEVLTLEEKLQQALVPQEEQPYRVPANWCWTKLACITDIVSGGTPPSKVSDYYEGGSIPWLTPADLSNYKNVYISRGLRNITYLGLENSSAKLLPTGTVCLSSRAPIGYVVIASNELSTNQGFKNFLPSKAFIPKYLYWYLKGNKSLLETYASGTTFLELSASRAGMIVFPLPPLHEQQRIVDRVESLFAKLDEAKDKAQVVVDGFEERKAAILHKAFTGELTAKWRAEHGVGMDSWEEIEYNRICNIVRGGSPRPAGSLEFYDGNIPFMKVADITQNNSPYIGSTKYTIKEAGLKKTRLVEAYTLLLTNSGATLGVPAICTIKTTFNDGIAAFLGLKKDTLLFHYYFWKSKTNYLRAINKGAAQPNLNTNIIGMIKIDLPTEDEQIQIAQSIKKLFLQEQQAKEAAESVLEQIDLIKKSILAKAFRGELGTNNPEEESAVELLKACLQEQ